MEPLYKDRDWLYEQYITNNLRATEIAVLCGCHGTTIGKKLKLYKIPIKSILGKSNPNYRGGKEIPCDWCGILFYRHPHKMRLHNFCSRPHWSKYLSISKQGQNNPRWMGGKSFEPWSPTFNNQFKLQIRERDNYTCICGKEGKDVHHIDYIKDNTVPKNCITLCKVCHGKSNYNRKYWQEVLTNIMIERNLING